MKIRLTFREETEDFKFPLILPSDPLVVTKCLYSLEINAVDGDSRRRKVYRRTGTSVQGKKMDQTSKMPPPVLSTQSTS
ncbi:hypothetical protein NPIL_20091 [Nephila pilipes]|uniref:Uncharacterized protein n=1 Tax=Nephila pilipes TaxID=299642 RepID=A0A8X6U4I1_NEPPI|nr:hypothetical protein NPIL_20091 [Nephila pilipes]